MVVGKIIGIVNCNAGSLVSEHPTAKQTGSQNLPSERTRQIKFLDPLPG
jgi:hypothetical protein